MQETFDLAMAWDWEFDAEFASELDRALRARGRMFCSITHHNLPEFLERVSSGGVAIRTFLDRASDTDPRFLPLTQALRFSRARFVNFPEAMRHAADKATMHLEFLTRGIDVPYTIIISPYNERHDVDLSISDLSKLGRPFIIKPANTTGGGVGVVLGAETLMDVLESRQHHKGDKYLLQETILPASPRGRMAWFRVFWTRGKIHTCWWHPETHRYEPAIEGEVAELVPSGFAEIMERIHSVCELDFFSTEIAVTGAGRVVVVDYVNETCDMRFQSQHPDGVPDSVVREICESLAAPYKSVEGQ